MNEEKKNEKKIQKNFYISSQENKDLIEKRCSDLAKKYGCSFSYILELAIFKDFFSEKKETKEYVLLLYRSEQNGIKITLQRIFGDNSSSFYLKAENFHLKPIVYYCLRWAKKLSQTTVETSEYLAQLFDIVIDNVKKKTEGDDKIDSKLFITTVDFVKQNFMTVEPEQIFKIVYDTWGLIGELSATCKFLETLISICEFEETPESRCELVDIISEIPFSDK